MEPAHTTCLHIRGAHSAAPWCSSCGRKKKWVTPASSLPAQWAGWEIGWASHISETGNQILASPLRVMWVKAGPTGRGSTVASEGCSSAERLWALFAIEDTPESCAKAAQRNVISKEGWDELVWRARWDYPTNFSKQTLVFLLPHLSWPLGLERSLWYLNASAQFELPWHFHWGKNPKEHEGFLHSWANWKSCSDTEGEEGSCR